MLADAPQAINLPDMQKTMQQFAMESERSGVAEEMSKWPAGALARRPLIRAPAAVDDALDSVWGDDIEEEADAVTAGIMSELGIELSSGVRQLPTPPPQPPRPSPPDRRSSRWHPVPRQSRPRRRPRPRRQRRSCSSS